MKHLFKCCLFCFSSILHPQSIFSQGCSQLNFKEESEISSTCFTMVMTMMHDITGKPYLYVANKEGGLKIYDISALKSPSPVKTIPITSFGAMDVMSLTQEGNYVYLALGNHFNSNQNAGMAVIDVTAPDKAFVTDFWELPASGGGAGVIKVEGNFAYIGAMKNGLIILDITAKDNIKLLSQIIPDINYPTINPNPDLYNARGMEVKNGVVYLCYDAGGIRIINTSNKSKPVETGRYSNPALNGFPRAYNNVVLDDSLLYVAVDYCGLEILNVKDTSKIKLKGKWNPYNCPVNNWFTSPVHANEIQYNKNCKQLFISTGKSDMVVIDVSNPSFPDSCNYFGGVSNDRGTWGVGMYQNELYLSYICAVLPFPSNWTGVKILTYTSCNNSLEAFSAKKIALAPNPARDILNISSDIDMTGTQISVVNTIGQTVNCKFNFRSGRNISAFVADFSPGVYYICISNDSHKVTARFIKE